MYKPFPNGWSMALFYPRYSNPEKDANEPNANPKMMRSIINFSYLLYLMDIYGYWVFFVVLRWEHATPTPAKERFNYNYLHIYGKVSIYQ